MGTGIDTSHSDLKVVGSATFVKGTKSYNDDNGHGTHVTRILALTLGKNPSLKPDEVRSILQSTAVDLGTSEWDSSYGYGRVDAYAAITATPSP